MTTPDSEPITDALIKTVADALTENRSVRQALPGGGMLNMDRLLPFLCVYRRNPRRRDAGTELFVTAEAAYLTAPGRAIRRQGLRSLVHRIAEIASARLGAFLILEIWSGDDREVPHAFDDLTAEPLLPEPAFRILTRLPHRPEGTVAKLEFTLQRIKIHRRAATVQINLHSRNHPPGMQQLISAAEAERINCYVLGLEIRPIYRQTRSGEVYQEVLRKLRRGVARALKTGLLRLRAVSHERATAALLRVGTKVVAAAGVACRSTTGGSEQSVQVPAARDAGQCRASVAFVCRKRVCQGAAISVPSDGSRSAAVETQAVEHPDRRD